MFRGRAAGKVLGGSDTMLLEQDNEIREPPPDQEHGGNYYSASQAGDSSSESSLQTKLLRRESKISLALRALTNRSTSDELVFALMDTSGEQNNRKY